MTDPSGNTEWIYDARGRVVREQKTILGETFLTCWAYNNADQLTSMIYPSGERINYTYLPQGTLARVGNYQTGTLVDAQNRVVEVSFGNGLTTNYAYNDWLTGSGRLLSKQSQNQNTGEIYQHLTHIYDPVGNITKITDGTNQWQEQNFSYDALNRLLSAQTSAVGEGQYSQTYGYDPATGNLNYRSDVGNYVYDTYKPHAVANAGSNIYVYDFNGNMYARVISDALWEFQYDAENRLVQIDRDGLEVNRYLYDGDGNRVAKLEPDDTGTIFIGNYFEAVYPHNTIPDPPPVTEGSGGENEPNAPNPLTQGDISYYYAGSQRIAMRDANGVYFLFSDHLGSSSVVIDESGQIVETGYYMPWGGQRGDQGISTTDYGYTGQMREGDIYYYGARWYDPAIGRFMQADTIVPMASQGTQAFDRYAYVNNNPLRYTDPSGHRLWEGDGGGDYNWHYDYVMNLSTLEEREQNAKTANAILDAILTVGSILFEPVDWAVTASECISGDCSPWALLGLMPLIPGKVGNKADDIIDIGKHLDDIPLHGQNHHIFSKKIWNAMSEPLKKAFENNRDSLIVQALDYAAHHGYQQWHRAVDNELRKFIILNAPTMPQLINKLVEEYTPLVDRFPDVLDILKRYR